MKPTHIHDRCCHCDHPLVPILDRSLYGDTDEWVCGREWEPGSGRDICEGVYFDWTLEQFQWGLGEALGLEWWEANKARPEVNP